MLAIHQARIYTPERVIENGTMLVEGGRIVAVGAAAEVGVPSGATVVDAAGLELVPGFIDLQFNGAFGLDFTENPETIWEVAARLPQYGCTSFLPTIITSPLETVDFAISVMRRGAPAGYRGTRSLGLHLEGPFLNPQKKGAHNPAHMRPPVLDDVRHWTPENGVALVTLAPEQPGASEMIRELSSRGIVVSCGHSMATYEETLAAFDAGATYGTHLFNAMPPLHHREPGLPGALLTDPRPVVGVIADRVHVHPAPVRIAFYAVGPDRLNLVTDAMAALGMAPGIYRLGDFDVDVTQGFAQLRDGTLAGCIMPIDEALRSLHDLAGCSWADALKTVTSTPARLLGRDDLGALAPGKTADFVLLSAEHEVVATYIDGDAVYRREL